MLNKYNKFIDSINENIGTISPFEKNVISISSNAKKSLNNIKYKLYSYYTNDKVEIIDGKSYWMIVRFEPSNLTEKTKVLENKIFWGKFIINTPKKYKLSDGNEIINYTYKFSGVDDSMNQYYDILKSNTKNIKILKNKNLQFAIEINTSLKQNQTNGFYLFNTNNDILDVYSNKLFIRKNDYDGEIVTEKTVEKRQAEKPRISLYSVYTNKTTNAIVVLLKYKDGNPIFYNLTTDKTESIERQNINKVYKSITPNEKIQFDKYIHDSLNNLDTITDINDIFNKNVYYIDIVNTLINVINDIHYTQVLKLLLHDTTKKLENKFNEFIKDLDKDPNDKQNKISIITKLKDRLDHLTNIKDNIVTDIINNIKTKITNIK